MLRACRAMCFPAPVSDEPPRGTDRIALGVATGWVLLRNRDYRRNLLFGTTLFCLVCVFCGAVFFGDWLTTRPIAFVLYWMSCFLLASFVLILAVYDLFRVRRDHRKRMRELDRELEKAAEEARRIVAEEQSGKGQG